MYIHYIIYQTCVYIYIYIYIYIAMNHNIKAINKHII